MRAQSNSRFVALIAAAVVAALALAPLGAGAQEKNLTAQFEFGIKMAKRGLWNEALFRFERVLAQRPGDARALNNMAVAYEAVGQFEKALDTYKKALERDSANRDLRRNYAQFLEFYQGLKPDEKEPSAPASAETAQPDEGGASSEGTVP